jgi:ubiquinone/menaquinone biosynthesis C-methylase UbiE
MTLGQAMHGKNKKPGLTLDEAVRELRRRPDRAEMVRDSYLGRNVIDSAARFKSSPEFCAIQALIGERLRGATILDLGAGTAIASHAFLESGARQVIAMEPDASEEVGQGAIRRLNNARIETVGGIAEAIPLRSASIDIVYTRQVLHHTRDLKGALQECARVMRTGGLLLATREHVVNSQRQLRRFLRNHPVHRLAGGENAFQLLEYLDAIRATGLQIVRVLGPWDTIINAFPYARTNEELRDLPRVTLQRKLGRPVARLTRIKAFEWLVWRIIRREHAGRMYSFLAQKV